MSGEDRRRWDRKWEEREGEEDVPAWLRQHQDLLSGGLAVDLATGRGSGAVWLAQRDYRVLAVDISRVAVSQARARAGEAGRSNVLFVQADLDDWCLPPRSVDLITVFRFLDRRLFNMISRALRPGGLLFYQTRTVGWLARAPGASPTYLLRRGELLRLSRDLSVVAYLETEWHAALVARRLD